MTGAARPGLACGGFRQDLIPSVLTRHFRVLQEAGVIRQHDEGKRRTNTLRKEELDTRFPGLTDMVLREGADQVTPPGDADCA
ncbi:ArsR family transcriptional regulator [Streptomyces sp. NPDC005374]|uniref:ArsR family transcriptional regulator n=1 Tax=Streptomyces sp. NPDC005374 TaxID=3364713 RepID=UPI0036A2513E